MQRNFHPRMVDFSPTEIASLRLIDLQRSAVYNAIKRGDLQATKDEHGHFRITQAEIDRYTSKRHREHPNFSSKPTDPYLFARWQAERGRAGGKKKAATHTKEEIAAPLRRGKLKKYARMADPEGVLPADELERRIKLEEEYEMTKVRMAKIEKEMLRRQYGDQQA